MIKSLYQINISLQNLRKQLLNQSSNSIIKQCIDQLLSQVKYLDQQQKSKYYFLISQIYATKFQNIQQAQNQLSHFDTSLNTQIYMNCQFRFAIYKFFQIKYKQANKHLDTGLGYVQQELKLTSNARFFFNRVINKQVLQNQARQNRNFQAAFILSLIYESEKSQILSLKLIESFLDLEIDNFQKFQIYRRLLQLYEIMKKNSISTISISKKSLQTYKQQLNNLKNRNPHFDQDFNMKVSFITKMIKFMNDSNNGTNQRLSKRMLDLKLLAYYKLKKCSKLAPNKEIKLTLMNSAKLIRDSKDSELLEETLNYQFVKNQYEKFKCLYKYTARQSLLKWQFINNLVEYSPAQQIKPILKTNKPPIQYSKSTRLPFQQKIDPQYTKIMSHSSIKPKQISTKVIQPLQQQPFPTNNMKQTTSQLIDEQFQGSIMIKVNASSQGYEQRYFYVKLDNLRDKPRLYYCNNPNKKNDNDSYYSLKGLKQIQIGKQTEAFQRKDTEKFSPGQCFSLIFDSDKQRNFYVPKKQNFHKWIFTLQTKLIDPPQSISKSKSIKGLSQGPKSNNNQIKDSMQMKKSRKVVQFD